MERITERTINDDMLSTLAYEKLKMYEDAEEDGRIVVLPCKPGDTVYRILGRRTKNGWNQDVTIVVETAFDPVYHYDLKNKRLKENVFLNKKDAEDTIRYRN